MASNNVDYNWVKRSKLLTQALIISGALNIGLVATFIYSVIKEKQTAVAFEMEPAAHAEEQALSNQTILSVYSNLSYPELLSLLENQESVEAGYKKRDLALGCLAAFHFFHLEKAIGSPLLQKRTLSFIHKEGQERADVPVFPGLTEDQFGAVIRYAKTERWPFTAEGLFFEVQQAKPPRDPTLLEAFYLTPEFHLMATLFTRASVPLQKAGIVELLAQGDWKTVQEFTEAQKTAQDLSPERLKLVLSTYLKKRSLLAAQILVAWDREFVKMRLDDADLMLLLDLLVTATPGLDPLLKELLLTPRNDAIWKKAAEKLYAFSGLPMPEPFDHDLTVQTFFPQAKPPAAAVKATKPSGNSKAYIVQQGDSLWKIAKKHKVSIEALKEKNHLESEKLRPGKELIIP
jgi:hypothetical protein